jgi:hypothetical protein
MRDKGCRRFGIGVQVRLNQFARLVARLGSAPSRTGKLRLKTDLSGRHPIPNAPYVVTSPYLRLVAWIEGGEDTEPIGPRVFLQ